MKTFFRSLPLALLVLLFIYAAASKLMSFDDFRGQLYIQAFPHPVAAILVYTIPAVEITAAMLLAIPKTQLAGLRLSLSLLILFTGYIILVLLHFWDRIPCSCGGILSRMPWSAHLLVNCFFIAVNLVAIHIYFKERRPVTRKIND